MYCNALHRTAPPCNALQRPATHCNALQRPATPCSALQRPATHCNTMEKREEQRCNCVWVFASLQCFKIHVSSFALLYPLVMTL